MKSEGFAAYSDESGTFTRRFQSIALVTGQINTLSEMRERLQDILTEKQVTEVKFELIRTHLPILEAAQEFLCCIVTEFANRNKTRVDILTWDMQDSRHAIPGRDDIANLERMYYKVFVHAARQWKNQEEWNFYPDESSQINWSELTRILNKTPLSKHQNNTQLLFENEEIDQPLKVKRTEPLKSVQEPLIQLADLLAGMARFTQEERGYCVSWLDTWGNKNQQQLPNFLCEEDLSEPIKTKQNRFWLVGEFNTLCKKYRMGVSLRTRKCLWTPDNTNPINFWNYETQHDYDQAPRRVNRISYREQPL